MQIKVRCVRPMMCAGERVEAGVTLDLTALEAADAIASGRAVLANPADAAAIAAAVTADRDQVLRKLGASRFPAAVSLVRRRA